MAWIYDIECFFNYFLVTFMRIMPDGDNTIETRQFEICAERNELVLLRIFLQNNCKALVGFNNLAYDSKLLAELLSGKEYLISPKDGEHVAREIYHFSQKVINEEGDFTTLRMRELDLFLMWHFNNEARFTSLKWIECHLRMENIMDIPFHHTDIITAKMHDDIKKYNINDCLATYKLYRDPKSQEMITVRKAVEKDYKRSFLNSSNSSMGEQIFLLEAGSYAKPSKAPMKFYLHEVILDKINFKSREFQTVLDNFRKFQIDTMAEKQKCDTTVYFDGLEYNFGLGGIHAANPKSYHEDVESIDVESFYPNLAIVNKFRPRHMGPQFVLTYDNLFKRRRTYAKKTPGNLMLKESLNSVFGKSNSIYSDLYDPMFTYAITINGQLLLAMLCERLVLRGAARIIMANTDGIEVKVLNRDLFNKTLLQWKELTGLNLEYDTYKKILIRDVNNYIALTTSGKIKAKGAYEVEKELNKDPSAKIVNIAVEKWFKSGDEIEKTIREHKELHDFAMFARAKTGEFVARRGTTETDLSKTMRYVIVKNGYTFLRKNGKKRTKIHSREQIALMNVWPAVFEGEIDYNYYISQAKDLTSFAKSSALELF